MAALLAAFERQAPGFHFVDVGANMGLYSAICGVMFDPGCVVAFEPTPDVAEMARRVLLVNGLKPDVWRVVQCALGAQSGTVPLHLSAISDSTNSLVAGFKESVGTIDVEVTTLDQYVEASGLKPNIVKIDVETFEPAVLGGAQRTLRRFRPWLVVEVLHRRGHDHGVELSAAMEGLGYSYYRLSKDAEWSPRPRINGAPGRRETDWLLTPEPIDGTFAAGVQRWLDGLAACTDDRNPRLPVLTVARHVVRRHGVLGLIRRSASYLTGERR